MQNEKNHNETDADNSAQFAQSNIKDLTDKLNAVLQAVSSQTLIPNQLPEWLDEKTTQNLLRKKTTALWKLRKEGKIQFSKIGGSTYYSLDSIKRLLNGNKKIMHTNNQNK